MSLDQGAAAPAGTAKSTPKLSRKRMLIVIQSLEECPTLAHAAAKAGIHRKTLEYWIKRSRVGDDGYDVEWQGVLWRFHNHCEVATGAQFAMLLDISKIKAPARSGVLGIYDNDLNFEDSTRRADPVRQWKAFRSKIRNAKD